MPKRDDRLAIGIDRASVPRVSDYFGAWAIRPTELGALRHAAQSPELRPHVDATPRRRAAASVRTIDAGPSADGTPQAIAVIDIRGVLMKQASSLCESTSLTRTARAIRQAARDAAVLAILLVVDSPGGTVSGTADVADAVRDAAARKPTWAFVEDLCASAAWWISAQATRIVANNQTALIGSIGTVAIVQDVSAWAAAEGIEVKVYTTGPYKAAGAPGTKVTAQHSEYFQRIVDETQQQFDAAALNRLTADQLDASRTGEVWHAAHAQDRGLIDAIDSYDRTLAALLDAARRPTNGPDAEAQSHTPAQEAHAMKTDAATPTPDAETQKNPTAAEAENQADRREAAAPAAETADAAATDEPAAASGATTAAAGDGDAAQADAATLEQIKAALPHSSAEFRLKALEAGESVQEAQARYIAELEANNAASADELAKARAAAETLRGEGEGIDHQDAERSDGDQRRARFAKSLGDNLGAFAAGMQLSGAAARN